ncbi:glucan synthase [Corynebacterium sp. LK22]|nr:glucan synthase [Corynebacterium sp. LK22]
MRAKPNVNTLRFMYELNDYASKVERVNAAWDRIEAKLGDDALEAPATEAELDQLEADLGVKLPDYVRASWLRHASVDGEPWDGGWIAPPKSILNDYKLWTQLQADGEFDDFEAESMDSADSDGKWYHEAWIPLVMDFGGNNYCLDMRSGKMVSMDHEVGPEFLDYADWPAYLEAAADSLEDTGLPWNG